MMDPKLLEIKNEVLKKVRIFKMKKTNLPDFIRKNREQILHDRIEEEKR